MPIVTLTVAEDALLTREQALDHDSWTPAQSATYGVAQGLPGIVSQALREIAGLSIDPEAVQVHVESFGPIDQHTPQMWVMVEPMDRPGIFTHLEALRLQITDQVADIAGHVMELTDDGIAVDIIPLMGVGGLRRPGQPDITW